MNPFALWAQLSLFLGLRVERPDVGPGLSQVLSTVNQKPWFTGSYRWRSSTECFHQGSVTHEDSGTWAGQIQKGETEGKTNDLNSTGDSDHIRLNELSFWPRAGKEKTNDFVF